MYECLCGVTTAKMVVAAVLVAKEDVGDVGCVVRGGPSGGEKQSSSTYPGGGVLVYSIVALLRNGL